MNKPDFFIDEVPSILANLTEDTKPLWGIMTPQHMIEHVIGSWMISNGRAKVNCLFEGDKLQKNRDFVFSDSPYKKGIQNPTFGSNQGLQKLRKASLKDAIDTLFVEMDRFFKYHEENPNALEIHPVFGELDYNGWLTFQLKHMGHHFRQFGLLE